LGLGVLSLQQQVNANQGYFAGRAGPVASAQQLQTQSDLDKEYRQTVGERQQYRVARRGELRQQRHTERLENAAFGLDTYKAQTDRADEQRDDRQQRREQNRSVNQWGYSEREWRSFTPEQRRRIMREVKSEQRAPGESGEDGLTPAQRRARRKERGEGINRVREVGSLWDEYSAGKVMDPTTEKMRPPTDGEIRARLRKEGYSQSEISIGLKVRARKPLTPSEIATARRMGIWPVPKQWRQRPPIDRPGSAPAEGGYRPT
jgi:hypothetical protein